MFFGVAQRDSNRFWNRIWLYRARLITYYIGTYQAKDGFGLVIYKTLDKNTFSLFQIKISFLLVFRFRMKIALFITKVSQYFCNPLTITQRSLVRKKKLFIQQLVWFFFWCHLCRHAIIIWTEQIGLF